ncbi:MAG: site-specific DNA-methyltransferase [Planctomycetota bacterium]|nr:site-specific DNA-methyltransferase [Planctomycetota bacterium]
MGDLLDATIKSNKHRARVYDPFAGSGTALTEAMMRGLDFDGQDINPMAVLLCKAKVIPFFDVALNEKQLQIVAAAKSDRKCSIECNFVGRQKWFKPGVCLELSRVRRAIRSESSLWARRFFWIALAETVRLTSNSRTSTFKLHIRSQSDIDSRSSSPLAVFEQVAKRNVDLLRAQKIVLEEAGHLDRGRYLGTVNVNIANSVATSPVVGTKQRFDILVTSPPYGDNASTVPYGQHSYLPLQWIDLKDIDPAIDTTCLSTTHEIDHRSLGGSRKNTKAAVVSLRDRSAALSDTLDGLKDAPKDRTSRVVAFCRDLDKSLDPVIKAMRSDAVMIWILGNRRVGGKVVPLDRILSELLIDRGARAVTILKRDIPSKRMAVRNNVAATMRTESIVVLRKGLR